MREQDREPITPVEQPVRYEPRPTDVAIVGIGCRFPGGVRNMDDLWHVLVQGEDVTGPVPADRWGTQFHEGDASGAGRTRSTRGAFLDDVDRFDADLFGIAPREAQELDPQQRLLLETAWAAMENSGTPRERWDGSRTGVYLGVLGMDYTVLHAKTLGPQNIGPYYASGKEFSFGAGRIAYTFGLHGPCVMLTAACASSLLAVHLAAQALRTGECDAALAGGVNLMLTPELSIFMDKIEALSPAGVCRPFDASADGVVRGEGCGVLVLKRYADAVAAGDRIWAVVRGSATNHDGRSAGLTAPNPVAQEALLRSALTSAGVAPADVSYVEAHATGTPLGDPIELAALVAVIGSARPADRPLLVGSHKANFGHLDSAAGVMGLLKAVLVARKGMVPPQINLDRPTPMVPWDTSGVRVATELTRLSGARPAVVGVSAFGLSGSNVHVVLTAPEPPVPVSVPPSEPGVPLLVLSGHSPRSLRELAAAYRDLLRDGERDQLPDILYGAATRRTHHDYRLAAVGRTADELSAALDGYVRGEPGAVTAAGDVVDAGPVRVVHVFSGQGWQWPRMGLDLYESEPVVRSTLDELDELYRRHAGWSVLTELGRAVGSRLPDTRYAQPAIFAVQVALSRLWTGWGLAPDLVVGHSMGEIAAAWAADTLTLPDAARVILERGRIMADAAGSGTMAAVDLPAAEVGALLEPFDDDTVCVAAVNGPASTVIAGTAAAVEEVCGRVRRQGATVVPLGVDYAFHSPMVGSHGDRLEKAVAGLVPAPGAIPMLSTVDPSGDAPRTDARYWGRNIREPVRFWPAVDRLLAEQDGVLFVEIGPHPVLARPLGAALARRGRTGRVVASLRRGEVPAATLAGSLAELYVSAAPVRWSAVHRPGGYQVELPPLPLDGERYWLPGVARGEQGGPRGTDGLRAEVRLVDGTGRVVAQFTSGAPDAGEPAEPVPPAPGGGPGPAQQPSTVDSASGVGTEQVAAAVGRLAAEALGRPAGTRLSRVRGFYELGLDSFSMVRLVNRLEETFGVELPASTAIEYPTINQLAEHIAALAPTTLTPSDDGRTEGGLAVPAARANPSTRPDAPTGGGARTGPDVEPVAIVGMACRLPSADGTEAYWRLLTDGVDAVGPVPADRWDAQALLGVAGSAPGTVATAQGAFLDAVDGFDNGFFRISAREARGMDPQQRLFLEVAWEALADAGVDVETLRGNRVGLFVGLNTADYQQLVTAAPENIDLYFGTGNSFSGTPGRLSYFLGVRGPSIAVDTACSSSLVAVHLACQSLRTGESTVALAGGSNVMLTPTVFLAMSAGGALALDGRCKTFSAAADGYGRGEGAAAVVLKTLSQARADRDRIYAVIRGSAVNHNGASGGMTVPSAQAQQEVIEAALAMSGFPPSAVDYVEAHGTGTRLGDAVELAALSNVLGRDRPADRPLLVGSVKTNIGHLEAAAGVAGLVKAALALWHGRIPPQLHCAVPSDQFAWDQHPIQVVVTPTPWPRATDRPALAGVSAFGITGTNSHVVLGEAPEPSPEEERDRPRSDRAYVLPVSAASPAALSDAVHRMRDRLAEADEAAVADICHTAGVRRSHLEYRVAAVGRSRAELSASLARLPSAVSPGLTGVVVTPSGAAGLARPGEQRRLAGVYGDAVGGLPWSLMIAREPVLRQAVEALDEHSVLVLGYRISERLPREPTGDPILVAAAQLALSALWYDHGLRPSVVVGRGVGELAAAYAVGLLDVAGVLAGAAGRPVRFGGPAPDRRVLQLDSRAETGQPSEWQGGASGTATWSSRLTAAVADEGPDVVVDLGFGTAGRDLARATGAVPLGDPGTPLDPDAVPLLAAEAYVWGCPVDWDRLLAGRGRLVRLPAYPWQRRRHWVTTHPRAAERPTPRSASPVDVVEVGVGIETGIGGRGEERSALPAERVITPDPLAIEDLLDVTLDAVAEVLGESGDISPDQGFFELGMDSVMAVNLKDRLESTLAITLPATLTFEFPTPRTLARHLGQFMVAQSPPVPLPVVDGGDASIPPGDMQTLSDDELAERLLSALHSSEDLLSGRG